MLLKIIFFWKKYFSLQKVTTLLALLVGAYGMFILPWKLPPERISASESYAFGFNNRAALLWVLGTFALTVLVKYAIAAREAPKNFKNYLGWVVTTPRLLPPWKEARSEYLLLGFFSLWMAFEVLFVNHLLQFPYWGESIYFLDHLDHLALGFHPHVDFQFNYGPLLLYGPFFLDRLTFHYLGIEDAYACFLILSYFLGFLGFFLYSQTLTLSSSRRCLMLLLFCLFWIPISMGLNYVPLRFVILPVVIVFFHRISLSKTLERDPVWYYLIISCTAACSLVFTFCTSPEMGCVATVALLTYGVALLFQHRYWHTLSTFVGIGGGLLFLTDFVPSLLRGMIGFSSGGYDFPIYPNAHNSALLIALLAVMPLLAISCLQHKADLRTPFAASLIMGAVGMLPAALGRCDPGHVMFNGLFLFTLLFPAAAFATRKRWIAYSALFFLLVILYFLSYWNHYSGLCKFAFSERTLYSQKKELIARSEQNWVSRKQSSSHGDLLHWKKTVFYPEGMEALDQLGTIATPLGVDLSLERFLKLQNNYRPCYYPNANDVRYPEDVAFLVSKLLTYDTIILPQEAGELSNSHVTSQLNLFQNTKKKELYEQQTQQHFLSKLLLYPVHSTIVKEHYNPNADLMQQLLPQCNQIGSFPGWIIVQPKKKALSL